MANRVVINTRKFGDALLRSAAVRDEVARLTEQAAATARGFTSDEIVTVPRQGRNRARGYVRRLGSGAAGEARDGALSRSL